MEDYKQHQSFLNIEAGITEYKGRVHLGIQPELQEEISRLASSGNINEKPPKWEL